MARSTPSWLHVYPISISPPITCPASAAAPLRVPISRQPGRTLAQPRQYYPMDKTTEPAVRFHAAFPGRRQSERSSALTLGVASAIIARIMSTVVPGADSGGPRGCWAADPERIDPDDYAPQQPF